MAAITICSDFGAPSKNNNGNRGIFLILLNWVGMDSDIKSKYDPTLIRVLVDGYLHLWLVKDEFKKYFGNTFPNLKYQ